MKLVILHLSDSHFYVANQISDIKINQIVSTLQQSPTFDSVMICHSGDVAYKGISTEYKLASAFLEDLKQRICDAFEHIVYIPIFVAPGNHDFEYGELENRTRNDLLEINQKEYESEADKETKHFHNFYEFAQNHYCFSRDYIYNPRAFKLDLGDDRKIIRVNLINSALFAIMKDDKGCHYFPPRYIDDLSQSNADLTITMMHHSPHWFNETSAKQLEESIYKASHILLLGHEHHSYGNLLNRNVKDEIFISAGGMLSNKDIYTQSEFSLININFDNMSIDAATYLWKNDIYVKKSIADTSFDKKQTNPNYIQIDSNFYDEIQKDYLNDLGYSLFDYFIFPTLEIEDIDLETTIEKNDEYIINIDDFLETLYDKKTIFINGETEAGKSTLCKYLFHHLHAFEHKVPLLFNSDNLSGTKYLKFVDRVFVEQYSDDEKDINKFEQLASNQRVAIVDDAKNLKDGVLEKLILFLKEKFEYIIVVSDKDFNVNIVERVRQQAKANFEFYNYSIKPFYASKRKELINKICSLQQYNTNSGKQIYQMEIFIKDQIHLFELNPNFIIQYIIYSTSSQYDDKDTQTAFTAVFEINIMNTIKKYCGENDLEETLLVLEEIAYYIHFNKCYPLPYNKYEEIILKYNQDYKMNVDSVCTMTNLKIANILNTICNVNGITEVKFNSNNILAFFIARKIRRCFGDGDIDVAKDSLTYILRNICFGINGDILLFLSYLQSNKAILLSIFDEARNLIDEWDEFSVENKSLPYIENFKEVPKLKAPTSSEKQEYNTASDESEKSAKEYEIIETKGLYDYTDDDSEIDTNSITKAITLTKMLAKILPSFYHILKADEKKMFIEAIYSYPNKIIYRLLKPIDDDLDETIKELMILQNDANVNSTTTYDDYIKFFQQMSLGFILGIYDLTIKSAIVDKTKLELLDDSYQTNINYRIQRLMAYENGKYFSDFEREAKKLIANDKLKFLRIGVPYVVRKCLLCHDDMDPVTSRKLLNNFFPKSKPALLIDKAKHQQLRDNR